MPPQFTTSLTIRLDRLDVASQVAAMLLVFNPWRAHRFRSVEDPPGWTRVVPPRRTARGTRPANVLRFDRVELGGPPPPAPLRIRSRGGRARLLRVLLLDEANKILRVLHRRTHEPLPPDGDAHVDVLGAEEYIEWVKGRIEEIPDTHTRNSSRFFFEYDTHSSLSLWANLEEEEADPQAWLHPSIIRDKTARAGIENAIAEVMSVLRNRIKLRTRGTTRLPESLGVDGSLEVVSKLQLDLYERHHDEFEMSTEDMAGAFEKFARGDLRLASGNPETLEPDSGHFFLFGEFALLAMDHGVDKRRWKQRARFLLRTQEVMAATYGCKKIEGPERSDTDFGPDFFDEESRPSTTDLARLRDEYDALSTTRELNTRATENVQSLMGEGFG